MYRLKQQVCLPLLGMMFLVNCSQPSSEADLSELNRQATEITQRFVGTLLPTLQSAMADGGPTQAIEVCSVRAPEIAAALSEETGWSVRRVSLKARNLALAEPDDWEREILQSFDDRQQAGEMGSAISTAAVVGGEYRFMQAQPAMPLCLTCHGQNISQEVQSVLATYYPNDTATGYTEGQIRGAISLRATIP